MSMTLTRRTLMAVLLTGAALTWAQPAQPEPQAGDGQPRGGQKPGLSDGAILGMIVEMDANGDILVDEKELNEAFAKLEKDAAQLHADLLAWLDKDKDGALTMEEMQPFFNVMRMLQTVRALDQNRDMKLQSGELDAAFIQLARVCQEYNDRLLGQFDKDGDGKLSEEEAKTAKKRQQRWGRGARQRGGN